MGARTRDQLAETLGALDLHRDPGAIADIERAVPPGAAKGERYPTQHMAQLDSER
jgi:hypothetical protein